jgi:hypothetical protein
VRCHRHGRARSPRIRAEGPEEDHSPLAYALFAGRWGVAHLLHTTCNAHLSPNIQRAPVIVSHSICASYLRPCSACMLGSAERLRRACRDVQTRQQAGNRRA